MKIPTKMADPIKSSQKGERVIPILHESAEQLLQQVLLDSTFEDAFYIVSLDAIVNQHRRWLQNLPRVQPFYAVKCNPTPIILKTLISLGCGFDCASQVSFNIFEKFN